MKPYESNAYYTSSYNAIVFLAGILHFTLYFRWHMKPYESNAYYTSSYNAIVFLAGILQRPFYSLFQVAHETV